MALILHQVRQLTKLQFKHFKHFTTRCMLAWSSCVILIVRLYVTCVLCDKTIEPIADILIPYVMAITLVYRHQQWLAGDIQFHLNFVLKMTHPLQKTQTSPDFRS